MRFEKKRKIKKKKDKEQEDEEEDDAEEYAAVCPNVSVPSLHTAYLTWCLQSDIRENWKFFIQRRISRGGGDLLW